MAVLSEQAKSVWAKTGGPTQWLPLTQHLADSLWVAAYLYDHWVAQSLKDRWATLGIDDAQLRAITLFLAGTHDVGKAAPAFVAQSGALARRAIDVGLPCHTIDELREDRKALPHSLISEHSLGVWLQDRGVERATALALASVSGAHHGTPVAKGGLRNAKHRRNGTGGEPWAEVRKELIDWISDLSGFDGVLASGTPLQLPLPILVELTGLVIVADWLASNTSLFPLRERDEDGAPARNMEERAIEAWAEAAMPPPWEPPQVDTSDLPGFFRQRFSLPNEAVPHAIQSLVVEIAEAVNVGLMFIETSTGGGKTEAALAAAEVIAAQRGAQGILVALPTQATTNAMFARVTDWLDHLPQRPTEDPAWAVTLGHSKASLNRRFAKMSEAVRNFDHVFNTARSSGVYEEDADGVLCNAVVHQWFLSSKRRMLANFAVVTIDQLLMAGLQRKHLMLSHLALSGKVVVIDEAHASDDFMAVYLESVLSWLAAYEVPVIVLSATLTAERRRSMMLAYARDRVAEIEALEFGEHDYPLVTTVPLGDQPIQMHVSAEPGRERSVQWQWHPTSTDELVASVSEAVRSGACVLVVRNTVGDAQATAEALAASGLSVTLNHAGFLAVDRANNDLDLIHRFGKGSEEEQRSGQVVVATQVVEQSLDIDFDVLFTDLAPVDLVLQRIGRLHRHPWRARPTLHQIARAFLLADLQDGSIPEPSRGSKAVYGDYLLLRTSEALSRHGQTITIPHDISRLVSAALGSEPALLPGWVDPIAAARGQHESKLARARLKASHWCVQPWRGDADERETLGDWLATSSDFTELAMGAAVRDTEPTLEVILVATLPDGSAAIHPPWLTNEIRVLDVTAPASDELAREVASWAVRIPARLTRGAIDEVIELISNDPRTRRWPLRRHPFLRSELLLIMRQTHEGSSTLTTDITVNQRGFELRYSPSQGLEVIDRDL